MTDGTQNAPTQRGAMADETVVVAPVVDYPETGAHAWSAEQWQVPTMRPAARMSGTWRPRLGWLKYLLPAAIVAVVLVVVLGGRTQQQQVAQPQPAPTPVVKVWTPTRAGDDAYLRALQNAGWDTSRSGLLLSDAHWTCSYLSQGHKGSEAIDYWDQQPIVNGDNPLQNHDDDVNWVGMMITTMCPQYN